jgi:hypothetical protein
MNYIKPDTAFDSITFSKLEESITDCHALCSHLNANYRDAILSNGRTRYTVQFFHTVSSGRVCCKVLELQTSVVLDSNDRLLTGRP